LGERGQQVRRKQAGRSRVEVEGPFLEEGVPFAPPVADPWEEGGPFGPEKAEEGRVVPPWEGDPFGPMEGALYPPWEVCQVEA